MNFLNQQKTKLCQFVPAKLGRVISMHRLPSMSSLVSGVTSPCKAAVDNLVEDCVCCLTGKAKMTSGAVEQTKRDVHVRSS